jgi:tRNA-binding protein
MSQDIYDAFQSVEMRIGRVLSAELNPKAKVPSFKMVIDFGELGMRNCSGQYPALYSPEAIIGKQVVCVMNLGSRRIAGFESQVLMLGAPDVQGNAVFLSAEQDVPLGSKVF